MEAGKWIRALREERQIKPSDIERATRAVAELKGNGDFYVPHSTLADIEAGSIPSIHKLFSLALALKLPLSELLLPFGIDPKEATTTAEPELAQDLLTLQVPPVREPFRFRLNFDTNISSQETTLLKLQSQDPATLPSFLQTRIDPVRYRYALIGTKDDRMDRYCPKNGSIVRLADTPRASPLSCLAQRRTRLLLVPSGWQGVDADSSPRIATSHSPFQNAGRSDGGR
ncbi:MAG: hypothetical protein DMG79_19520 [Acidobacteria bacterium]|nr:MAG: hypothetical protein DMG79_19520 [Acidobacteriota bacterium]